MKLLYTFFVSAVLALVSATSRRRRHSDCHGKNKDLCPKTKTLVDGKTYKCEWVAKANGKEKCKKSKVAEPVAAAEKKAAGGRRRRHH